MVFFLRAFTYILVSLLFFTEYTYAKDSSLDSDILINSDNLNFFLDQNKAIFEGKVEVFHGKTKLESDKLVVLFDKKKENNNSKPSNTTHTENDNTQHNKPVNRSPQGAVSYIEALGHVILTTENDVITGDKGYYEVKKDTITLVGNVELKQNNNFLKGDKLVYNRITNESLLTSNKTSTKRVIGRFIPEEKND
jgi:lipopolysaccharide export system protein LptA